MLYLHRRLWETASVSLTVIINGCSGYVGVSLNLTVTQITIVVTQIVKPTPGCNISKAAYCSVSLNSSVTAATNYQPQVDYNDNVQPQNCRRKSDGHVCHPPTNHGPPATCTLSSSPPWGYICV